MFAGRDVKAVPADSDRPEPPLAAPSRLRAEGTLLSFTITILIKYESLHSPRSGTRKCLRSVLYLPSVRTGRGGIAAPLTAGFISCSDGGYRRSSRLCSLQRSASSSHQTGGVRAERWRGHAADACRSGPDIERGTSR